MGQFVLSLPELESHLRRQRNGFSDSTDPEQHLAVFVRENRIILVFPYHCVFSVLVRVLSYELTCCQMERSD